MKAVVQRVRGAKCAVDGKVVSEIEKGLVVYVGVFDDDTDEDTAKMARKVAGLRVFTDENGKLARSAADVGGSVMVISNFVLAGRVTRGFRPDCTHAAKYEAGKEYYEKLVALISESLPTVTGVFGAHMEIEVHNDGPINIVIDTRELRT
ncbi:MAG: D-tyrosyl-tRNA(Tyr) deacylase [Clostridia bacterium]|nr:D-tyrosyl-tRNA(Tyr) deacylase [Clostridia bacterium]